MSEPFIGQICQFGFNFAPRGWSLCNGQLIGIPQNSALFSLLGTTYGGDGRATFGLPDFQGRGPIHQGQGSGLSPYVMGQKAGAESATLQVGNMPPHSHSAQLNVSSSKATKALAAAGDVFGKPTDIAPSATSIPAIYSPAGSATDVTLGASSITIGASGGGQPVGIIQPYLTVSFCIAMEGIFPSRN